MERVVVHKENESHFKVYSDDGVAWELRDHFAFEVPGHRFMPAFRSGMWDGKIRIFNYNKRSMPLGLWSHFKKFCEDRDYEIELEGSDYGAPGEKEKVDPKEVWDFVKSLNLHAGGKPIEIRDYQFNAICKSIEEQRLLLLSPTGSGKSLIIYCLLRWYQEKKLDESDKVLVIVPTTSLVEQMYGDFDDYSSADNTWHASEEVHRIYSGKEKVNLPNQVFVSTWQSIYKLPKTWFRQFVTVFGDEAHGFTAKSMEKSMEKAERAKYRFGLTGTLDGSKTNELVLQGIFGRLLRVTRTRKLQDEGTLAKLKIEMLELVYPTEVRKTFGKVPYQSEVSWLIGHEGRNRFIRNLALSLEGNTLVMFRFVEKHGKILHDIIDTKAEDGRRVFFVAGETDTQDREAIRKIVERENNAIIVASLGTFSTGINIKNLHNIVFASPSKSQIKVLQSIGRGLRIAENGQITKLYDLVDRLDYRKRENYALKHAKARVKIYKEEDFEMQTHKVNIK